MDNQSIKSDTTNQATPERTEVSFFATRIEKQSHITSAMIIASVDDPADIDESRFKTKLRNALSEWAQTTTAGQEAWEESSEDFNFGDLAEETDDSELVSLLAKAGIHDLQIDIVAVGQHSLTKC